MRAALQPHLKSLGPEFTIYFGLSMSLQLLDPGADSGVFDCRGLPFMSHGASPAYGDRDKDKDGDRDSVRKSNTVDGKMRRGR